MIMKSELIEFFDSYSFKYICRMEEICRLKIKSDKHGLTEEESESIREMDVFYFTLFLTHYASYDTIEGLIITVDSIRIEKLLKDIMDYKTHIYLRVKEEQFN